jgi:hypothetical protein
MERRTFVFRPSYQCELRPIQPTIPTARGIAEARFKAPDGDLRFGLRCDRHGRPHRVDPERGQTKRLTTPENAARWTEASLILSSAPITPASSLHRDQLLLERMAATLDLAGEHDE